MDSPGKMSIRAHDLRSAAPARPAGISVTANEFWAFVLALESSVAGLAGKKGLERLFSATIDAVLDRNRPLTPSDCAPALADWIESEDADRLFDHFKRTRGMADALPLSLRHQNLLLTMLKLRILRKIAASLKLSSGATRGRE